jgi:hypothetical protein
MNTVQDSTPDRQVHTGDGVAWLRGTLLSARHAVVTSLPDFCELPSLDLAQWRAWFSETAQLVCERIAPEAVAIFYQTDIKHEGRWIDKSALVHEAAASTGAHLLWHKIVCRVAPGATTFGRPAYAHLQCFSRALRIDPGRSTPDVLPIAGEMTWPRAMPREACDASCRFLLRETGCRVVVDPFCGMGTMLAVANAHGLSAIGVELSRKRARKARALSL